MSTDLFFSENRFKKYSVIIVKRRVVETIFLDILVATRSRVASFLRRTIIPLLKQSIEYPQELDQHRSPPPHTPPRPRPRPRPHSPCTPPAAARPAGPRRSRRPCTCCAPSPGRRSAPRSRRRSETASSCPYRSPRSAAGGPAAGGRCGRCAARVRAPRRRGRAARPAPPRRRPESEERRGDDVKSSIRRRASFISRTQTFHLNNPSIFSAVFGLRKKLERNYYGYGAL